MSITWFPVGVITDNILQASIEDAKDASDRCKNIRKKINELQRELLDAEDDARIANGRATQMQQRYNRAKE